VSGLKQSARAGAERLVRPYLEPIVSELGSVRQDVVSLVAEIRERLGAVEAHNRATTDEVRGLRGSMDLRLDQTNLRLHQILDEVGGVRDRFERLEQHLTELEERFQHMSEGLWERWSLVQEHFDNTSATLVGYFDEQAQRQSELRSGMDELWQATRQALEKLELLVLAQLEGLFSTVSSEAGAVRSDVEELTRMIRMQGDASDQVAEVMGRALNRLSAEVETLSAVVPQVGGEVAASPA